ncbi:MAG: hypothetical protein GC154_11765 [bacterium]|nr:hypothetical protein [bacterium]
MENWLDLETRFKRIADSLKFARLDEQTGAAGEYWRLAACPSKEVKMEFESLSNLAGQLLNKAISNQEDSYSNLNHPDPVICWYRALKQYSGSYEFGIMSQQINESGEGGGWIYSGTIYNPGSVAANVCLYCHGKMAVQQSLWMKMHDDYIKPIVIGLILALAGTLIASFF